MENTNKFQALSKYFTNGVGKRVLEVGCGEGDLSAFLADHYDTVVAIDSDDERVATAREKLKHYANASVICADGSRTGLESCTFDDVVVYRSLHFMENVPQFFAEAGRLLRPGGRLLVINSPNFRLAATQDDEATSSTINDTFSAWCQDTFRDELEQYWSKSTAENFNKYCDPSRNEKNSPFCDSVVFTGESIQTVPLINLKTHIMDFTVAKKFEDLWGEDSLEEEVRSLQEKILQALDYEFHDLYFENIDVSITRTFYTEIHAKPM